MNSQTRCYFGGHPKLARALKLSENRPQYAVVASFFDTPLLGLLDRWAAWERKLLAVPGFGSKAVAEIRDHARFVAAHALRADLTPRFRRGLGED